MPQVRTALPEEFRHAIEVNAGPPHTPTIPAG
jgi:hypothetical protein